MALGKIDGTVRGITERPSGLRPRKATAELVDFFAFQARKRTIKELQYLTGLSAKAIEKLRLGHSGASTQTVTTWCQNDDDFRDAYFHYCGGADPQTYRGLSMAVNAYLQRHPPKFRLQ